MASTIKVTNIDTPDGTGSITIDRPTVLQAGDIITADIAADAIDGTKLADNACDSEHYTDGSIDLVHLQTGTDGQIISWDASGDPVAVGPGTDGQVLTSTGAGSPPAFETAAGGSSYFLIHNSTTAAAARIFTGMSTATYTMGWWIYFNNVYPSSSADIELLVSADDGSSYHSDYSFVMGGHDWDGAAINRNVVSPAVDQITLNVGLVTPNGSSGMSGWLFIPQSLASSNVNMVWSMGHSETTSGDRERYMGMGACDASVVDINAFKFIASDASNVNGHIQVYGLKPS